MRQAPGELLLQVVGVELPQRRLPVDCSLENAAFVTLDAHLAGPACPEVMTWIGRVRSLPRFVAMPGL